MAQFLDTTGLQTLWNKIKETFVPQNWLMADYTSGSLQQTPVISSACPSFPITTGDVGFYRDSSSNVSGETQYHLYCVTSSNIDLCSCVFKSSGFAIQGVIMTLIRLGVVSMSGNFTDGATLTPLRKIVKFSDNEYLVPKTISGAVNRTWIFYDNFNSALSALLSGNDTTQTS